MYKKLAGMAVLAVSLLAAPGFAQTAAELLQKGIYNQQSTGNLDAAIQIYRQVVSISPDPAIAAQGQYLLGQTLLAKGDLQGAAQEFARLARDYAQFRELIAQAANRPRHFQAQRSSFGTLQAGRYHHNASDVEFSLPPGWSIDGESPSSDDGEMVILTDSVSKVPFAAVWLKPDGTPPQRMADRLAGAIPQKISQRREYKNYEIRPGSIQNRIIGGQQALLAVADYEEDGVKMAESLNWIYGPKSRVFFFARMPAAELVNFQPRFEQMIFSAMVP